MSEAILVACREKAEGEEVERMLQDLPYRCTLHHNPDHILEAVEENGAEILILAANLADDELIAEIHGLEEAPEIIYLVGELDRERIQAKLHYAAAVCSSPLSSEELQHAVKETLSKRGLRQNHEELKHQIRLLTIMNRLATVVNLDQLLRLYLDALMDMLQPDWGCILLYKDDMFEVLAEQGQDTGNAFKHFPEEFLKKALDVEGIRVIGNLAEGTNDGTTGERDSAKQLSALMAPLIAEGERVGLCMLAREQPRASFSEREKSIFQAIHENIGKPLQNAVLVKRTRKMTLHDDLTNAYNRRYFEDYLTEEFHRAERYKKALSIIFLDIDNLKEVNDTHGHIIGSKALKEVARRLLENMRTVDRLVRFGGDEFCLILPETSGDGALMVAERLREAIADHPFLADETAGLHLTGSFGIATFPVHASTVEELVKMADEAMYSAKAGSKNSVTLAEIKPGSDSPSS